MADDDGQAEPRPLSLRRWRAVGAVCTGGIILGLTAALWAEVGPAAGLAWFWLTTMIGIENAATSAKLDLLIALQSKQDATIDGFAEKVGQAFAKRAVSSAARGEQRWEL